MKYILSVEDAKFFSAIIKKSVESSLDVEVITASTMAEAEIILKSGAYEFYLSVLDIHLPDAPNGEIIDLVLSHNISVIVFTSEFDEKFRLEILSKPIIDYVLKDQITNLDYLITLIQRIIKNNDTEVLAVDDSRTSRKYVVNLLELYHFQVFEAENGLEALKIIEKHPNIKLLVTDYNMPIMNGIELTKEVRRLYPKRQMAIIGFSTAGNGILSARFLKSGGNDFINKPFLREEFFCRITQNITLIDYIRDLEFAASKDFLTGLCNRRVFFMIGKKLIANAMRKNIHLTIAMMDIDCFKEINDKMGHGMGDEILSKLGVFFSNRTRESDMLSRIGGEEFALIATNMDPGFAPTYFEELRAKIEAMRFEYDGCETNITISIGATAIQFDSLAKALQEADKLLYKAKKEGRNRVELSGFENPQQPDQIKDAPPLYLSSP